jgi:hypothetical protein
MIDYRDIFKEILKLNKGESLYINKGNFSQAMKAYNSLNNLKLDYRILEEDGYIKITYTPRPKKVNNLLKELKNIVGLSGV